MSEHDPPARPWQVPAEQWTAALFGTLYALLFHQVTRDVFPDTPVVGLSQQQDMIITARVDHMIQTFGKRMFPHPVAQDDQKKGGAA